MKTLKQLTKDFDYVNSEITEENFPLVKRDHKGYKLFHLNQNISSKDAIKEMRKEGYEPASLLELLEWTEWNGTDVVVALGSVAEVGGGRHVSCLDEDGSGRRLSLGWFDRDWFGRCRFLGVRLSSETGHLDTLPDTLTINGVMYKRQ